MRVGLFLLLLIHLPANGQPGYLGKKTTVTYNLFGNLQIDYAVAYGAQPFSAYTKQTYRGEVNPKFRHQIEVDHVVGRMTSAGVAAFMTRTANWTGDSHFIGFKTIGGFGYLKFFKGSKRGSVAPCGPWGRIGLGAHSTTFLVDRIPTALVAASPTPKALAPLLAMSAGNTRIFYDSFIVNVGVDFIFTAFLKRLRLLKTYDDDAQWALTHQMMVNFSVGIGGLF
jgi:hypothetical protein